ncbi:MAG: tetratricopeptide repeat protein [Burkholderiales bacterium]|nr:tetratricopeptide repeat protein [Burkholderiales bacterium]MCJ7838834.1 tetratricopeptide repeat protein [Burkholderiales bacterium]
MNALVVAALVFFAAWLSVLVSRSSAAGVRKWLVWLGPVVTATAAGGLYAWYETPAASTALATATPRFTSSATVLGKSSELDEMGRQLANKLGQDAQPAPESAKRDAGDLRELSKRLAEKLERDPQNGPGWALLARSYSNTGQFGEAEQAFAKAAKLQPNDASLFADWADAYLSAHEGKWDQSAADIVKQALAIDPKLPKALALAGAEAGARGDYKAAADYWTRAKAVVPPDSAAAREAEANLKEAKERSAAKG